MSAISGRVLVLGFSECIDTGRHSRLNLAQQSQLVACESETWPPHIISGLIHIVYNVSVSQTVTMDTSIDLSTTSRTDGEIRKIVGGSKQVCMKQTPSLDRSLLDLLVTCQQGPSHGR